MASKNVSGDEWTELVGASLEDDYTFVVEDAPVYLAIGDKPDQPVAGLPLRKGVMHSAEIDRGERVYARSQTDVSASVRPVPGIRIDGSNERSVNVSGAVQSNTYDRGDSFDTSESDSYPITIDPAETVEQVLLSIVGGEVEVKLETEDGDVVTLPIDAKATIDSYSSESVTISDPGGNAPRVAGGWAGE